MDISVGFAWISCAPAGSKSGVHIQLPTLSHLALTYIADQLLAVGP